MCVEPQRQRVTLSALQSRSGVVPASSLRCVRDDIGRLPLSLSCFAISFRLTLNLGIKVGCPRDVQALVQTSDK